MVVCRPAAVQSTGNGSFCILLWAGEVHYSHLPTSAVQHCLGGRQGLVWEVLKHLFAVP